jgi:hypothetical protein
MVIKSYFEKNNTILRNQVTNTGLNPITELYYGGNGPSSEFSRFIFKPDLSRLAAFNADGTIKDLTKAKHVLKLKNTGLFDLAMVKRKASSFDLILFDINQEWDEGAGYNYTANCAVGESDFKITPSNWVEARSNESWNGGPGIFTGTTTGITTQHFDAGNEDLEMDVTSLINNILSGATTNYGFGIAFDRFTEETPTTELQYVGFFTRHTNTLYEPYIETTYDNPIKDDRSDFYLDKANKLYLYVNLGGEPTNLDSIPTVTIKNTSDVTYSSFTTSEVSHVTKGVYSIELKIPTEANVSEDCMMFTDTWSNIVINGINRPDIELDFPLIDSAKYYNIGDGYELPKNYTFSVTGIMNEEQIVRGDVKKILVSANIPYTVNQKEVIDNIKYRVYTKEGPNEVTIINYNDINRANSYNYFLLDTAGLIPTTYYLDIKSISNNTTKTHKGVTKFTIVGLSELNK